MLLFSLISRCPLVAKAVLSADDWLGPSCVLGSFWEALRAVSLPIGVCLLLAPSSASVFLLSRLRSPLVVSLLRGLLGEELLELSALCRRSLLGLCCAPPRLVPR